MTFRENIREFWLDMTLVQRIAVVVIVLAAIVWIIGSTYAYLSMSIEVRRWESKASVAEAEKNDVLAAAAKIAGEIRAKEKDLIKREAIIDEETKKLPAAVQRRVDAERELERVRANPRADAPTADGLCQLLANAGHPCR